MNIRKTSRVITAGVIVLSLLALFCSLVARRYATLSERAYETRMLTSAQVDRLAAGSDRLTDAVRAYAATGDKRYWDQFQKELKSVRSREEAVAALQVLGLEPTERELIERAKRNSDALVHIENRAFEALDKGDVPGAIKIVYG